MSDPKAEPQNSSKVLLSTLIEDLATENVGSVIGPYKLLQQIGQGGFGVVYMAEQEKPVRRVVALKIIKPGMDTGQVIARFESERQALALMDHPNIAKVLDAGATASGHPYFVMELVKGVPITEFCDKNHLPPDARLKLFVDVCHAIQHAHHKGIIHRDIKPTNVMVTLHDSVPVVKVIDFGVAKATVQKLTERTLFTAYGQMIGTPEYMSPEQAEMSGLDIDTRSDVYSLGVLLYELLTGTTPIEAKTLREAGYAKMQKLIQEEEPPRPSTRLSSLGDTATAIAGNRGLDVKRLAQILAGDLDWVVMKSLEKDRNRRYPTPDSFAEDIERYLRDEAITARPPSRTYRLKKLVQRNKPAVFTTAVVAIALLVGSGLATWQAIRATHAENAALLAANAEKAAAEAASASEQKAKAATQSEKKAKDEALAAATSEKKAKEEAVAREAESKAVLSFVEDHIVAAARPQNQEGGLGKDVTLRKAIESALPFVEKSFPNEPLIEARLRLTLANSFHLLGDGKASLQQAEAARALYTRHLGPENPNTLRSMDHAGTAYTDLGRYQDALDLDLKSLAIRKRVFGPDDPVTLRAMRYVAHDHWGLGHNAEAQRLLEELLPRAKAKLGPDDPVTVDTVGTLANTYQRLGRYADALRLNQEAYERLKSKFGDDHPKTMRILANMAGSYAALGRYDEASARYHQVLSLEKSKLGADHPDTLRTMVQLADLYSDIGKESDAANLLNESLRLKETRLGHDHPDTIAGMNRLAVCYERLGRYADALKLHDEALALEKAKHGPDDERTVAGMERVAKTLARLHRGAEAVALINQAAVIWEKQERTEPFGLYRAACIHSIAACALRESKKTADANQEADRAMAWLKKAVAAGFKVSSMRREPDLDSLWEREDFKKLMTELERAQQKDKAKP